MEYSNKDERNSFFLLASISHIFALIYAKLYKFYDLTLGPLNSKLPSILTLPHRTIWRTDREPKDVRKIISYEGKHENNIKKIYLSIMADCVWNIK